MLAPLLFNIFFAAVINVAYKHFKVDKDNMDALVHLRDKPPLWGMLYADHAGVVSQSPKQPRKMMGAVVVVSATFGRTVSGAKTEIMRLRTKGILESTVIFSVEAAGEMDNQTNEFAYLGGNVNHNNTDLSIEIDRRIRNAWYTFRKYTLELYDRPSAPLELRTQMLRAEVLYNAGRLHHDGARARATTTRCAEHTVDS